MASSSSESSSPAPGPSKRPRLSLDPELVDVDCNCGNRNSLNSTGPCQYCKYIKELLIMVINNFYKVQKQIRVACSVIIKILTNQKGWKLTSFDQLVRITKLPVETLRQALKLLKEDKLIYELRNVKNSSSSTGNLSIGIRIDSWKSVAEKLIKIEEQLIQLQQVPKKERIELKLKQLEFQCVNPVCSKSKRYKAIDMECWYTQKIRTRQLADGRIRSYVEKSFICKECKSELEEAPISDDGPKLDMFLNHVHEIKEILEMVRRNKPDAEFETYKAFDIVDRNGILTGERRRLRITDDTPITVNIITDEPIPKSILDGNKRKRTLHWLRDDVNINTEEPVPQLSLEDWTLFKEDVNKSLESETAS